MKAIDTSKILVKKIWQTEDEDGTDELTISHEILKALEGIKLDTYNEIYQIEFTVRLVK